MPYYSPLDVRGRISRGYDYPLAGFFYVSTLLLDFKIVQKACDPSAISPIFDKRNIREA
jgi:hypothetical protein